MPSFFILMQCNEKGDNVATIAFFFLFVCRAAKKATVMLLLSPF
jgi:hypothetical protein